MSNMDASDRVTLRHYIETLIGEYQRAHTREHILLAEGVKVAREAVDARLENMNEFRAQILSERGMMVTKERFDGVYEQLSLRLQNVEKEVSNLKGKVLAYVGVIGVILIVVQIVLGFVLKGG